MKLPAVIGAVSLLPAAAVYAQPPGWWMTQPIRWVQTNLRETDASLNPQKFVGEIADFDANVLLMAMGGISAFYPSKV